MAHESSMQGSARPVSREHGISLAGFGFGLFIFLGGLMLFSGNVLTWVDSSIIDSGEFNESVNGALDKPEVQQRIADVLALQVVENSDLQDRLQQELPERLSFAGPLLAPQVQPFIAEVILRLLETDFAGTIRNDVVLRLHQAIIDVLEDREGRIRTEGNSIVLDLGSMLERVFDRLGVTPPSNIDERGQVVLVENATGLQEASFFVRNREVFATGALLLSLAFFGLAILTTSRHRHGFLICGYAVAAVGILTLLALWLSNMALDSAAEDRVVLREVVRSLETNLRLQSLALILLGACIVAVADERVSGILTTGYDKSAAAIERFGVSKAALIGVAGLTVLLLMV